MKRILLILTGIAAFLCASCEHKELCYDHSHNRVPVLVVFDWENAPDAEPAGMSLFLFPKEGGGALRYEFSGREGGEILVPVGRYDAVCVNSDSETVIFRHTDRLDDFEICTREAGLLSGLGIQSEGAPRVEGTEDQRVVATPDMLWTARTADIVLTLPAVRSDVPDDDSRTIVLYPAEAVCHYSVEIRNAENLRHVAALGATLTGMSGGVYPATMRTTDEPVTLPFAVASDGESVVAGEWLTFGHCPGADSAAAGMTHKLVIYAVFTNGEKWFYTYDVTEQVHAAPDPRHVHILLDGLPLPEPSAGGGGFRPDVGDWQVVDIEISM